MHIGYVVLCRAPLNIQLVADIKFSFFRSLSSWYDAECLYLHNTMYFVCDDSESHTAGGSYVFVMFVSCSKPQ